MSELGISYNKLWKLLVDKKMSKADLRRAAGFTPQTLGRLRRDEVVSTQILMKICVCLECKMDDILDIIQVESPGTNDE